MTIIGAHVLEDKQPLDFQNRHHTYPGSDYREYIAIEDALLIQLR
jgi:hypothetical protein